MFHELARWWPLIWALALLLATGALLTAVAVELARQVSDVRARSGARPDLSRLRLLIGADLALIAAIYLIPA